MLNDKKLDWLLALTVFLISFGIYFSTMAPSLSFWDCGELIAASHILGNPHPPGNPLLPIGRRLAQTAGIPRTGNESRTIRNPHAQRQETRLAARADGLSDFLRHLFLHHGAVALVLGLRRTHRGVPHPGQSTPAGQPPASDRTPSRADCRHPPDRQRIKDNKESSCSTTRNSTGCSR